MSDVFLTWSSLSLSFFSPFCDMISVNTIQFVLSLGELPTLSNLYTVFCFQ